MAGGFFSAVLESGCQPVVGASGGIFGLMGLFMADLIMNFRSLTRYVAAFMFCLHIYAH